MDKSSFVMYTKYLRHIQKLTMEQRGMLFTAILSYASDQEMPELDAATDMAFSFIQEQMDRDNAAYTEKCRKRSEAGKLGGRPKANAFNENQKKQMVFLKSKITLILILIIIFIFILILMMMN